MRRSKIHEVPLEQFTKSDPEDSDFELEPRRAHSTKKTPSKKKKRHHAAQPRRRHRESYESDEEIEESELDSVLSFSAQESDEEVEINPRTGRPTRKALQVHHPNYAESSASSSTGDDIENSGASGSDSPPPKHRSLIVTLKFSSTQLKQFIEQDDKMPTKPRRGSRAPSEPRIASRRSARLSAEPEDDLVELSITGRPRRQAAAKALGSVGGKTVAGHGDTHQYPSMILEESQEDRGEEEEPTAVENAADDATDAEAEDIAGDTVAEHDVLLESIENIDQISAPVFDDDDDDNKDENDDEDEDSDGDDMPIKRGRHEKKRKTPGTRKSSNRHKSEESDEFQPEASDDEEPVRPGKKLKSTSRRNSSAGSSDFENEEEEIDPDEILDELDELNEGRRRNLRAGRSKRELEGFEGPRRATRGIQKNYNLLPPEIFNEDEIDNGLQGSQAAEARSTRATRGGGYISSHQLFNMAGPFGGMPKDRIPKFGVDPRINPVDSDDSSDDDAPRPAGPGGVPLTPQATHNMGKTKGGNADITPVEVPKDINFDSVGGLDDRINSLKEMVMLPLLYPELFTRFKSKPPRGVLFSGPPGTGKTLLARALAGSCSDGNRKVTFFMRKGSDVMSKYVGEAERQLRLLFDEAKKNSPAIIFFDEFDGLAPVRSAKQEQIHASIVSTLLALMDGMDDRGQIVIIGATNRPDSIDPAFRRPGRFDREFRFELPNLEARLAIIDIHTRGWDPAPSTELKNYLAKATIGFAGADLSALCAEAAVAAIQRTFPQIYRSEKKLLIDPALVKVNEMDFLKVMDSITPSTQRENVTAPEPIPKRLEPLLQQPLEEITEKVHTIIPAKRKRMTALEEAEYGDGETFGFQQEEFLKAFDLGRIFRPRLLIRAKQGMGQQHLTSALMNRLDGFYVRSLDIATLHSDSVVTPEAMIAAVFKEAKRNQPSVLLIPEVDVWYSSVRPTVINTFSRLLKSLKPTDAVLVLGTIEMESDDEEPHPAMMKDIFGFSAKHEYQMTTPGMSARLNFFEPLKDYIKKSPTEFPDPENRKKRKLPQLPLAPEQPKSEKSEQKLKEELKVQRKADKAIINLLRSHLRAILKDAMTAFKRFQHSIIPDRDIEYLLRQSNPDYVASDLPEEQRIASETRRPYEVVLDKHGNRVLLQTETGKRFYNCNLNIIQERVINGYYKRPNEFLWDVKTILKDWMQVDNPENIHKANDLYGGLMGEVYMLETREPILMERCEAVYKRELEREKTLQEEQGIKVGNAFRPNVPPPAPDSTIQEGPIQLGAYTGRPDLPPPHTPTRPTGQSGGEMMTNGAGKGTHDAPTSAAAIAEGSQAATAPLELDTSGSRPQFPAGYTVTPSNPTTASQQPRSQQSALEKMAPGTQAEDYANDASTTNSAQKTASQRTSGNGSLPGRQGGERPSSNGTVSQQSSENPYHVNWEEMIPPSDSQLPDTQSDGTSKRTSTKDSNFDSIVTSLGLPRTQSNGSQFYTQNTQNQPVGSGGNSNNNTQGAPDPADPAFIRPAIPTGGTVASSNAARYASNMAPPHLHPITTGSSQPSQPSQPTTNGSTTTSPAEEKSHPPYVLDEKLLSDVFERIGGMTKGLTVEQLEMVDARCMATIWETRGSWDRNLVMNKIIEAVKEVLEDVEWQQNVVEKAHDTGYEAPVDIEMED